MKEKEKYSFPRFTRRQGLKVVGAATGLTICNLLIKRFPALAQENEPVPTPIPTPQTPTQEKLVAAESHFPEVVDYIHQNSYPLSEFLYSQINGGTKNFLFGEDHEIPEHHQIEVDLVQGLSDNGIPFQVIMEIDERVQNDVNQYLGGEIDLDKLNQIEATIVPRMPGALGAVGTWPNLLNKCRELTIPVVCVDNQDWEGRQTPFYTREERMSFNIQNAFQEDLISIGVLGARHTSLRSSGLMMRYLSSPFLPVYLDQPIPNELLQEILTNSPDQTVHYSQLTLLAEAFARTKTDIPPSSNLIYPIQNSPLANLSTSSRSRYPQSDPHVGNEYTNYGQWGAVLVPVEIVNFSTK